MKPNEVVKIRPWPVRASCSIGALGIGFRHALHEGRLDLVAEGFLDRLAALVVLVAPAVVADRADIDEADFELLLLGGGAACRKSQGRGPGQSADDGP